MAEPVVDLLKLNEIIKDREITQLDIAKLLGTTQSNVSSLLNGHRRLRIDTILIICREFDIPISSIINDQYKQTLK